MPESYRLKLAAFPNSPYAAELQRGAGGAFSPKLEAEYARVHLRENRTLVRVATVFSMVLGALRGVEQIAAGSWDRMQLGEFVAAMALSTVLAVVACTPWFDRHYLPFARILVPIRNALVAVTVASVAAQGQLEALMLLPLLVIGPFFVLGLHFRAALFAVVLALAVYLASAMAFELALPLIARSCTLLFLVAVTCGIVARNLERTTRASFLERHLIVDLAQRDALTGLKNRRVFDEHLEGLWQLAVEEARVIAILLIDVDHFKAYNDLYGHQAGDQALQRVATTLEGFVTRSQDVLARYGGEEFAVILYDIDTFEAETLADSMRCAVKDLAFEHRGAAAASPVTISVGVAIVEPSRERRSRGALQLADQALYEAKQRGRNRVELLDQAAHDALETGVFARTSAARG